MKHHPEDCLKLWELWLVATNPASTQQDVGSLPGLAQWGKDQRGHELWCRPAPI